jgi:rubredoxin
VEYKCPVCQHVEDPQVNGWGVEGVALFTDLKVAMEFAK